MLVEVFTGNFRHSPLRLGSVDFWNFYFSLVYSFPKNFTLKFVFTVLLIKQHPTKEFK